MIIKVIKMIIENRSRMVTEHTQYTKTHRWPNGVLTHGGAYASIINIKKNKGASGLNTDIYRHNPYNITENMKCPLQV
jgi:hypothetical protein